MSTEKKFDWESMYQNTKVTQMPWYNPNLDIDVESVLDKLKIKSGTFLDLGTGPATQAKQLKDKGFEVTGVDISKEAISLAKQTYPGIESIWDDILQTNLSKKFDFIFDRGCFHVIDAGKRKVYSKNVFNLLNDPGLLFLKCFSDKMPDNRVVPHPISEKIIKDTFEQNFIIEEITETEFKNDKNLINAKGLFIVMKRRKKMLSSAPIHRHD